MAMLDFDFIIHIFEVERPWPREYNRRHPNYDNFRVLIYSLLPGMQHLMNKGRQV